MTRQHITLQVNGDAFPLTVRTDRSLADVLREDLRLIGTKIGCNEGDCGACTVLVDGQTICGCLYLAVEADGPVRWMPCWTVFPGPCKAPRGGFG